MRIDIVTLFPDFFGGPLAAGLLGKAIASGAATIGFSDPRDHAEDRHRTVDDTPYGGGAGMLMKVEPVAAAVEVARARGPGDGRVVLLSPQGKRIDQADLRRLASLPHLILVSGRYEGIDERISTLVDEELSLGDFVLTGGEYAALALVDGIVRLLPGTLGNARSSAEDSFSAGILEGPQYTRPPLWRGLSVPEALLSGHHAEIRAFHRAEGLVRTRARRPDLLEEVGLDKRDREAVRRAPPSELEVEVLLAPAPGSHAASTESLAALLQIARAYGVARVAAVGVEGPVPPGMELHTTLEAAIGPGAPRRVVSALPFALKASPTILGPRALAESAQRERARVVLALGRGLFDGKRFAPGVDLLLPSLRVGNLENDLPLAAAASIILDRLIGER